MRGVKNFLRAGITGLVRGRGGVRSENLSTIFTVQVEACSGSRVGTLEQEVTHVGVACRKDVLVAGTAVAVNTTVTIRAELTPACEDPTVPAIADKVRGGEIFTTLRSLSVTTFTEPTAEQTTISVSRSWRVLCGTCRGVRVFEVGGTVREETTKRVKETHY